MRGMQARNAFDRIVEGSSLDFKVQLEINEITVLLNLVASTHMVTVVSQATARLHHHLVAVPIKDHRVDMEGCYHLRRNGYVKYAATAFVSLLDENKTLGIIEMRK